MPTFTLTKMAKADMKEIAKLTQNRWGREQRNLYLQMLDVSFHQLAVNPLKGKDCSDIRVDSHDLKIRVHLLRVAAVNKLGIWQFGMISFF